MTARKLTGNWMFFSVDGVCADRYKLRGSYTGPLDETATRIARDYGIPKNKVTAEVRLYSTEGAVLDTVKFDWDTRRFA